MTSIRTTGGTRWLAAVLLLTLALVSPGASWLGAQRADGQTKEFKVGVALSLSGIFSKDAGLFKEVYDLWAETVNKAGGIKVKGTGYPIRITYYDDESSPQKSAQLIERLATADQVDLILAGFGSSIAFAATAVAEKYKYPYISGAASANPIFERGYRYFFATLNKTFDEVEGAAKVFALANPRPVNATVIGSDHLFGKLSAEGFRKVLGEMDIHVVHFEIFPLDLTDYNSLLLKVKRQNPDILLVGGLFSHALRVMKAAKEVDFSPKGIAFSYGPTVPEFLKEFGKDAEGFHTSDPPASQLIDASKLKPGVAAMTQEMVKRYKAFEPDIPVNNIAPHVSMGFNNMWILLNDVVPRAITKYGGFGPDALAKAARDTDIPEGGTMQGYGVKFNPPGHRFAGQNERAFPAVFEIIEDKFELVFPKTVATSQPLLPLPASSPLAVR